MLVSEGITRLLVKWSEGDETALEQLTIVVYDELRRMAAGYLRNKRSDNTLQATALVHEAYLRLLDMRQIEWQNRAHFVGVIAQMMRRILIDHERERLAQKRGAGVNKFSLSRAERIASKKDVSLIALDDALTEMAKRFPRQTRVTELHFFGGLTVEEISQVLSSGGEEISKRTVERDLRFAKAWLHQEIAAD